LANVPGSRDSCQQVPVTYCVLPCGEAAGGRQRLVSVPLSFMKVAITA
jgi:hypothetical protein